MTILQLSISGTGAPVLNKKDYFFPNRALFLLFTPILVELFLKYSVGLADSIMVSHVGVAAVSGVSLVDFVMQLLISLFAALCTGGAVIAGQYLGKKDDGNAREAADQLIRFVAFLSVGIMILTYVLKPYIFSTLFGRISDDVRTNGEIYFHIVVASIPFLALLLQRKHPLYIRRRRPPPHDHRHKFHVPLPYPPLLAVCEGSRNGSLRDLYRHVSGLDSQGNHLQPSLSAREMDGVPPDLRPLAWGSRYLCCWNNQYKQKGMRMNNRGRRVWTERKY